MLLPHRARGGVVCLAAALILVSPAAAFADDPVYDQSGAQYGRGFFAPLPFERIDTVTGNVLLTFSDLVLPGNAGFNLSIIRTYNSRDGRWRFGIGGAPLRFVYNAPGNTIDDVDFITPDSGEHNAAGAGSVTTTREFWRFTKATRVLELPNGLVATYGHLLSDGGYLTELRDPFDNTITLTWQSGAAVLQSITQHLGNSQTRTVSFGAWTNETFASMTYDNRTWTYAWQMVGTPPDHAHSMTSMTPPTGAGWSFTYGLDSASRPKMLSFTTPNGGTVTYTWAAETFPTTPSSRVAVKTRVVGGPSIPAATWTFDWQDNGATFLITGPANKVTYQTNVINGIPVGSSRTLRDLQDNTLETDTLTYESVAGALGPIPVLKTATVTRGTRTFTTTYSYSGSNNADYGQPNQIVAQGELTRTTALTYNHSFGKYIRGRVASAAVTVNGQTTTSSSQYDGTTGFLQSSTVQGVTSTFTNDGRGNVSRVTDATSRSVDYAYSWGVVNYVESPGVVTTRAVNSDGTVATETTGSVVATYQYDAVGRVTSVSTNTAGRVGVTTTYDLSGGRWASTTSTRGGTWVRTDLDGWGRAIHSEDSTGVHSKTTHDAAGRVVYRSRPYGGGVAETGDTIAYDALGRRTLVTRVDGSTVGYDYEYLAPGVVRTTESLGPSTFRYSRQKYEAFGSPSDARLSSVRDATDVVWDYSYNGAGQLTSVSSSGSGVPTRTWAYHSQGFLASATQPESGTTTYSYDAVGRLLSQTDARAVTVTSGYDSAGRLVTTDAPGTAEDVTTTYDAEGRTKTVSNGTVQSTLTYDTASRVTGRTDVIAGKTFVHTFVYDGHDNLIEARYPVSDRRVLYEYDSQNRLTAVRTKVGPSGSVETLASSFVYRGDGSLASYQYGNGQTFSATQDNRQRPQQLVNGPLNVTYAYDHVGNVTSTTDARSSYNATYQYDLLDRLTQINGYGARSYTYNAAGDRLTEQSSAGTITFNYNGNRQLSSLSGSASGNFTYDATGSLLTDPSGVTYTYSALGAQQTSVVGGQTTSYAYGGGGSRAVKTGPDGVPHLFVYGAGGGPIAEYTVVGTDLVLVREYIYMGGTLLAAKTAASVTPPPMSVSIATPASGTVSQGTPLTLTATVTVGSGLTVARVEYYNGWYFVGQATSAPYSVPWPNGAPLPGSYTLIARVVLTDGRAVSSPPVLYTVQ